MKISISQQIQQIRSSQIPMALMKNPNFINSYRYKIANIYNLPYPGLRIKIIQICYEII